MACNCGMHGTQSVQQSVMLTLVDIIEHDPETFSFDFTSDQALQWFEGDSSKIYMNVNGQKIGKKFSCATLPSEGILRFTTRIRKEHSQYKEAMRQLNKGDQVEVSAPRGHFRLARDGRPVLLVSNGVGIATMRSLVKSYASDPSGIGIMTQINVDANSDIYKEEFDQMASSNPLFRSIYTKHRDEFYETIDFESQKIMFATGAIPYIHVVGSDRFVYDVQTYLMNMGFMDQDILTDGLSLQGGGCSCGGGGGCGCGANIVTKRPQIKGVTSLSIKSQANA